MRGLKKIKSVFRKAVDPFINALVKLRVTPNMVTTSALLFLAFTVYFIIIKNTVLAGLLLMITGVVDAVDGALAKKVGSTRFGDFYDAFIDRLVEAVVYIAIAAAYPSLNLVCFIAFTLSYLTSYVAARAEVWTIGVKMKYLGVGGRAGRLTILVIAFLLDKLELGLYLIIFAALITVIARSVTTMRILTKKD